MALPGKRSVEIILLTKKPVALVKQSVESILLTKKPECPGKRSGEGCFIYKKAASGSKTVCKTLFYLQKSNPL